MYFYFENFSSSFVCTVLKRCNLSCKCEYFIHSQIFLSQKFEIDIHRNILIYSILISSLSKFFHFNWPFKNKPLCTSKLFFYVFDEKKNNYRKVDIVCELMPSIWTYECCYFRVKEILMKIVQFFSNDPSQLFQHREKIPACTVQFLMWFNNFSFFIFLRCFVAIHKMKFILFDNICRKWENRAPRQKQNFKNLWNVKSVINYYPSVGFDRTSVRVSIKSNIDVKMIRFYV